MVGCFLAPLDSAILWPWGDYLTFLGLRFLICKMERITKAMSLCRCEWHTNKGKALRTVCVLPSKLGKCQLFILCFISLDAYNTLPKYIIGKRSDSSKFNSRSRKEELQARPGSFICTALPPCARTGIPSWTPSKAQKRHAQNSKLVCKHF